MAINCKLYKKKVILFLDILGIGNFTMEQSDDVMCQIYTIIENASKLDFKNTIERAFRITTDDPFPEMDLPLEEKELDVSISILSDSIVISFSKNFLFLLPTFLRFMRGLSIYLLSHNLLIRGSVAYDKIYHPKGGSIIFGKGLVKAYRLEKDNILPAIVIDPLVLKKYGESIRISKLLSFLKLLGASGNIEVMAGAIVTERSLFYKIDSKIYYNHLDDLRYMLRNTAFKNIIPKPKRFGTYIDYYTDIINKNLLKHRKRLNECKDDEQKVKMGRIVSYWEFTKKIFEENIKS